MTRVILFSLMGLLLATAAPAETESAETENVPAVKLTDAERASLLTMREEEKLARDVYTTLGDAHDLAIFRNIAAAEQRHMDAILGLLRKYEIEDSAGTVGSFSNETIAKLFVTLVAQGKKSPLEALAVGAKIEDLDIHDLQKGLEDTENADIRVVYSNLMRASRNHLRAFTSQLSAGGVKYVPGHLGQEEYDAILASDHERGHGVGAGFRGGRGQGGGQGQARGSRGGCDGDRGQARGGRGQGGGRGQARGSRGGCDCDRGQARGGRGQGGGRGQARGSRGGCDCERGRARGGRGKGCEGGCK